MITRRGRGVIATDPPLQDMSVIRGDVQPHHPR